MCRKQGGIDKKIIQYDNRRDTTINREGLLNNDTETSDTTV